MRKSSGKYNSEQSKACRANCPLNRGGHKTEKPTKPKISVSRFRFLGAFGQFTVHVFFHNFVFKVFIFQNLPSVLPTFSPKSNAHTEIQIHNVHRVHSIAQIMNKIRDAALKKVERKKDSIGQEFTVCHFESISGSSVIYP